jgi:alpha-amylase/alpha-mannosidase (GH57 family)
MRKFVCIHGHFYQPPRENPWLEAVELQDSASPFHDWNERIVAECYGPNAHARLLDGDGRIRQIASNYAKISFNFGPTLLSWMKERAPDIHQAIVAADQESRRRFGGHGSALAQCYNHVIMPLASHRDKRTQVLWGLRDFEHRFERPAEGMWLPECAADNASCEVLAEFGIRFTILSPYQASRVRPLRGGSWRDVNNGRIDPTRPYLVKLPSGRSLTVFFYDGPISRAVAFEQLLTDGERFANRLMEAFDDGRKHDQLVHIATDGESYGHHFRYGEMALAYALHHIEANRLARLSNYAEFLSAHPPAHEVQIHQPSAWSCCHGVDRWRRDCGCNSGGHPNWNQQWRRPLREALDWLRDQLAPLFGKYALSFLKAPWTARDQYISVILDRSPESLAGFFSRHACRPLAEADQITALRLLEMQRNALLMYTSCGWFFDELSGIETVQVIQYAARAIQLANDLLAADLEPGFLDRLAVARSNIAEFGDGRQVYERFVKPAVMDREKVGAHYAVSSLFESYPERARIYSFTIEQQDRRLWSAGKARLAIGQAKVTFEVTRNSDVITYGVLHLGEHNLNCGVRRYHAPEPYQALVKEMREAFGRADFAAIIRLMDKHFGDSNYSIRNLFRDEQRRVLNQILGSVHEDVRNSYRLITDRYAPLLRFLADLPAPAPKVLEVAFESVLNSDLRAQFESDAIDAERVRCLLQEVHQDRVVLDAVTLGYAMKGHMERRAEEFAKSPESLAALQHFLAAAELLKALPFEVNLWKPQNAYWITRNAVAPAMRQRADSGDETARIWTDKFRTLGEQLRFHMERNSG